MGDDALIRRAKGGDPEAWRELYRAHAGRLLVWLGARSTGDAAVAAEDVAAEAWLTAATKVADFSGDTSEFAGWLFGIARNLTSNAQRRSARRRTDPATEQTLEQHTEPVDAWLAGREWVRSALAALPPRERDVVGCTDVVGLDVESTARALGISQVAVRVARHRGLRRLRGVSGATRPSSASAQSAARAASTSR